MEVMYKVNAHLVLVVIRREDSTTMRIPAASLVFLVSTAPLVFGHGQVHSVVTNYGTYAAADAYAAVDPTSPLRKLNTYGPAANFTGPDITCGVRSSVFHPSWVQLYECICCAARW